MSNNLPDSVIQCEDSVVTSQHSALVRYVEINQNIRRISNDASFPISKVNSLIVDTNSALQRYSAALTRSAQDVIRIYEILREEDHDRAREISNATN